MECIIHYNGKSAIVEMNRFATMREIKRDICEEIKIPHANYRIVIIPDEKSKIDKITDSKFELRIEEVV